MAWTAVFVEGKALRVTRGAIAEPESWDESVVVEIFKSSAYDGDDLLIWITGARSIVQATPIEAAFSHPVIALREVDAQNQIAGLQSGLPYSTLHLSNARKSVGDRPKVGSGRCCFVARNAGAHGLAQSVAC